MSSSLRVYGRGVQGRGADGAVTRQETVPLVTFALGRELLAADVRQVDRVVRVCDASPVPNAPEWLVGMIAYRDAAVPLINLRLRLQLPDVPATDEQRIVIFVSDTGYTAALVDRVLDVRGVPVSDLEVPPPLVRGLSKEYISAMFRRDERIAIMLNAERLLSATERLQLNAAS